MYFPFYHCTSYSALKGVLFKWLFLAQASIMLKGLNSIWSAISLMQFFHVYYHLLRCDLQSFNNVREVCIRLLHLWALFNHTSRFCSKQLVAQTRCYLFYSMHLCKHCYFLIVGWWEWLLWPYQTVQWVYYSNEHLKIENSSLRECIGFHLRVFLKTMNHVLSVLCEVHVN